MDSILKSDVVGTIPTLPKDRSEISAKSGAYFRDCDLFSGTDC